jgi:hypothetical protein
MKQYPLREYRAIQDIKTGAYSLVLHTKTVRSDFMITAWCNPSLTGCYVFLRRFTDTPFTFEKESGFTEESDANGQGVQDMKVFISDPFHMSAIEKALARITTHETDDELVQLGRELAED